MECICVPVGPPVMFPNELIGNEIAEFVHEPEVEENEVEEEEGVSCGASGDGDSSGGGGGGDRDNNMNNSNNDRVDLGPFARRRVSSDPNDVDHPSTDDGDDEDDYDHRTPSPSTSSPSNTTTTTTSTTTTTTTSSARSPLEDSNRPRRRQAHGVRQRASPTSSFATAPQLQPSSRVRAFDLVLLGVLFLLCFLVYRKLV
eukprot:TRINITY_DN2373_c3_g1_i1.p1 TRINITY_DN2373_c3_g1~~TRINITY_DN2373_c3_g1_i1.p1  ORF type:complete len:200 (+),score=53.90 TRINITY_DN2373_c3_g1_i1:176-775(+)